MKNVHIAFGAILLVAVFFLFQFLASDRPPAHDEGAQSPTPEGSPSYSAATTQNSSQDSEIRVELYHFHGTNQCYSCVTVGELAEKTASTYFASELESGKLVFGHVNGELPENKELVEKYAATGSSLWIGTYVNGQFSKEQNINVWYKISNEADYLQYLKGVLEKRLKGDLS